MWACFDILFHSWTTNAIKLTVTQVHVRLYAYSSITYSPIHHFLAHLLQLSQSTWKLSRTLFLPLEIPIRKVSSWEAKAANMNLENVMRKPLGSSRLAVWTMSTISWPKEGPSNSQQTLLSAQAQASKSQGIWGRGVLHTLASSVPVPETRTPWSMWTTSSSTSTTWSKRRQTRTAVRTPSSRTRLDGSTSGHRARSAHNLSSNPAWPVPRLFFHSWARLGHYPVHLAP